MSPPCDAAWVATSAARVAEALAARAVEAAEAAEDFKWQPTHRITWTPAGGRPQVDLVQLFVGAAYTRAEWNTYSLANWDRDDEGAWSFQGRTTPGGAPGTVDVVSL